jgi:2-iminoacetate synthase ThiH
MDKQTSLKLPNKPDKPNPSECCDSGCENCVFVYYEKAVKRWQAEVEKIKKQQRFR